ncbi:hypothetical protein RD792_012993, partial [Penstemon davidsonii]
QSSTRWTPTSEQIRILKDLYYNNGVRSPTAEQIQRISAKLRQYGKIEGKNVFYWFQNHKARERQKKRFTSTNSDLNHLNLNHMQFHMRPPPGPPAPAAPYNNFSNINIPSGGGSFPSSSTSLLNGSVGNYATYGSMAMEKSFRECSINNGNGGGSMGQNNIAWIGTVNEYQYPTYPFLEKRNYINGHDETLEVQEEDENTPEIETLPLFPMHGDDLKHGFNHYAQYREDSIAPAPNRASLELTLNSFFGNSDNYM